jgi:type II secretory pathway pseudopilin PulG
MRARFRSAGFTIVEMGIVIAVIAILAGVVITGMGFFRAAKQRAAVDLISTLRKAGSQYALRHSRGIAYGRSANLNDPQNVTLPALRAEGFLPMNPTTPWGDPNIVVAPANGAAGTPCAGWACMRIDMPVPEEECAAGEASYLLISLTSVAVPNGVSCNGSMLSVTLR